MLACVHVALVPLSAVHRNDSLQHRKTGHPAIPIPSDPRQSHSITAFCCTSAIYSIQNTRKHTHRSNWIQCSVRVSEHSECSAELHSLPALWKRETRPPNLISFVCGVQNTNTLTHSATIRRFQSTRNYVHKKGVISCRPGERQETKRF